MALRRIGAAIVVGGGIAAGAYAYLDQPSVLPEPTFAAQVAATSAKAVCILRPDGDSGVSGVVEFLEEAGTMTITATVTGLTTGKHGFHIHELGDLRQGCHSAGGHYNPHGHDHAGPDDSDRHVGDLGNIEATEGKEAVYTRTFVDGLATLDGEYSIVGRSVVVHAGEDDLGRGGFPDSKKTGHAGGRVACGVIGLAK